MSRREFSERHRQQRTKNYAVLAAILAVCAVFYFVFIVRAGFFG